MQGTEYLKCRNCISCWMHCLSLLHNTFLEYTDILQQKFLRFHGQETDEEISVLCHNKFVIMVNRE